MSPFKKLPDYHLLLDKIPSMIGYWDTNLRNVFVNKAYAVWFGIAVENVRGAHILDVIGEERYRLNLHYIEGVLRGESQCFECVTPSPDGGKTRHSLIEYIPSMVDGAVCGFFVIVKVEDISSVHSSVQRYQRLYESMPDSVLLINKGGHVIGFNQKALVQYGYSDAEMMRLGILNFEAEEDQAWVVRYKRSFMESGRNHFLTRHRTKSGSIIEVEADVCLVNLPDGESVLQCVFRYITERKQTELSLQIAGMIYQCSDEAMMVTDADNLILDVNPAFTKISGFTLDEVRGKSPRIFKSGLHDAAYYQAMWSELIASGHWCGEMWDRKKNGELYVKLLRINTVLDKNGKTEKYVGLFSDITEKKKADELVQWQATVDTLTQLPNRRLFNDRLEQELKVANRNKSALTVLFIDLDRFKQINDTFGHAAGDTLLVEAAQRICSCVRTTDTVARIGGDEFVAVLPGVSERAYIERIAAGIIEMLAKPFTLDNQSGYISASIGIYSCIGDLSADQILKRADIAMYAAKRTGRNCYKFFEDGSGALPQD